MKEDVYVLVEINSYSNGKQIKGYTTKVDISEAWIGSTTQRRYREAIKVDEIKDIKD